MSEDDPMNGNVSRVEFTWATNPDNPRELCVIAAHDKTRVHFDFTDDGGSGTRQLQQVLLTIPTILSHIRQEQMIKRESDEIDKDLFDLLGDDDA